YRSASTPWPFCWFLELWLKISAPSLSSCCFHWPIWFGWTPCSLASSLRVFTPFTASRATLNLNWALKLLRFVAISLASTVRWIVSQIHLRAWSENRGQLYPSHDSKGISPLASAHAQGDFQPCAAGIAFGAEVGAAVEVADEFFASPVG